MAFYKDGIISIPNVTGDIVITATAVAQAPHYTNLADQTSAEWKRGQRLNSSHAIVTYETTQVSNPIYVVAGDVIRVKNAGSTLNFYTAVFPTESATQGTGDSSTFTYDATTGIMKYVIGAVADHYWRVTITTSQITGDIIITKNEEIPS